MSEEITPICQHVKDKSLYLYRGNDVFESIVTGKQKTLGPEIASKIMTFNISITEMCNDYPDVLLLLKIGFRER